MLPFKIHSFALEKPTSLGRKKLAAPSKTIPLLANGKANFDFFEAILMSIAKVIVAPIPTAAPLIAAGAPIQLSAGHIAVQAETAPIEFRRIELLQLAH